MKKQKKTNKKTPPDCQQGLNWISTCKSYEVEPLYLKPYTKINPTWIKDRNGRAKTIKLLDKNTDVNLCESEPGD